VCPRGHLLHLAGSRDDEEVAASFKAATFIGTALALEVLEVKAIASPAAMVRKKSMLRMKISPEVSPTNDAPFQFHACRAGEHLIRWMLRGGHKLNGRIWRRRTRRRTLHEPSLYTLKAMSRHAAGRRARASVAPAAAGNEARR
jgi:hypothetical protein